LQKTPALTFILERSVMHVLVTQTAVHVHEREPLADLPADDVGLRI
jgi:hypothetical protein